jgi:hypothetical protein
MRTDSGNFFFQENNIIHNNSLPNQHRQTANVERPNKMLVSLFNGYMNAKVDKTGKVYIEWTDKVSIIRKDFNAFKKKQFLEFLETKKENDDAIFHEVLKTKDLFELDSDGLNEFVIISDEHPKKPNLSWPTGACYA